MTDKTMLESAMEYVAKGFKVLPVNAKKIPLLEHGLKDATQTQLGVKEYWGKWPAAGIAVVTDGLVVLDFDLKSGGLESLQAIQEKFGALPETKIHKTGGGGFHYLYRNPGTIPIRNTTKFAGFSGVDIRADGGYIVVPPSPHESGNCYEVYHNGEIQECPMWILEKAKQKQPSATGNLSDAQAIPQGKRNVTLLSLAGSMRRRGLSADEILPALTAINLKRCQPPLTDDQLLKIAKSVEKYQPDPVASLAHAFEKIEQTEQTEQTETVEERGEKLNTLNETEQVEKYGTETEQLNNQKTDKIIWRLVDDWFTWHKGEQFELDTICHHLDLKDRDTRQSVAKKLAYEVKQKKLEKFSSPSRARAYYKYLDTTLVHLRWYESETGYAMDALQWPQGRDGSKFGFDGTVSIPEKALIVVAGVTNTGKSVFCRNFLWANMDTYQCRYFSSETSESDFGEYASRMTWAYPIDHEGKPKFELVSRHKDWKDVLLPDGVNIIDWLNLGDAFYQLGTVLEEIKNRLNKGICLIAIQKDPNKELGMGGMWGEHLTSLYLTLDFERLTVKKAKKWQIKNPNGKTYGFGIIDQGTHFSGIHLLKKCGACWNGKVKGAECPICYGSGFVDDDTHRV